jgi:hypothetical protein
VRESPPSSNHGFNLPHPDRMTNGPIPAGSGKSSLPVNPDTPFLSPEATDSLGQRSIRHRVARTRNRPETRRRPWHLDCRLTSP